MDVVASSKPSRGWAWTWGVGVVLLVAAAAAVTWHLGQRSAPDAAAQTAPGASLPRLAGGGDYYLHVKLIEVSDHRPDGKTWDTGGSGPDIRFNLTWHGNIIWESTVKPDTLIGSWDLMKIDLKQVITSGGTADLESAINAPLIHYAPGETVKLTVWDDDAVDTDAAGEVVLKLDDLSPGDNTLTPPPSKETGAIRRIVLTLIDRKTPIPKLIETMSNR